MREMPPPDLACNAKMKMIAADGSQNKETYEKQIGNKGDIKITAMAKRHTSNSKAVLVKNEALILRCDNLRNNKYTSMPTTKSTILKRGLMYTNVCTYSYGIVVTIQK